MKDAQLVLRLPADLRRKLEALAVADRRSLSDFVRLSLEDVAARKAGKGGK